MQRKGLKVIVGMSGGVDSSVSAALLQDQGFDVVGVFVHFWSAGKNQQESREDAFVVAKKLNIPFYTIDVREEFKQKVVRYFLDGYQKGETPNPCVFCNKNFKFQILFEKMKQFGAEAVATGHYARIQKVNGKYELLKGEDDAKDQSYFLYTLNQEELSKLVFPLGEYTKEKVRTIAKEKKLPVFDKMESQDVCFLAGETTENFLKKKVKMKPGKIVNTLREEIGTHQGLPLYTIGQRKGINIGGKGPFYVVAKDFKKNQLIVTNIQEDLELFAKTAMIGGLNWISGNPVGVGSEIQVKTRYRHPAVSAIIEKFQDGTVQLRFKVPERAITPGQSAVFYDFAGKVLGGGIIKN